MRLFILIALAAAILTGCSNTNYVEPVAVKYADEECKDRGGWVSLFPDYWTHSEFRSIDLKIVCKDGATISRSIKAKDAE